MNLNLTPSDISKLAACGISQELAAQSQLRRVDSQEGGMLVGRNGSADYSGIVFPNIAPGETRPREYRLRRDHPEIVFDKHGRPKEQNKYLSPPRAANYCYFAPGTPEERLADTALPIILTEGEKKCLSLRACAHDGLGDSAQPRFLPVAIAGVWNFKDRSGKAGGSDGSRRDVSDLNVDIRRIVWQGRQVTILFDTNVGDNGSVQAARWELTKELRKLGAVVSWFVWPGDTPKEVNGIDDLIGLWGIERVRQVIQDHTHPAGNTRASADSGWPKLETIQSELPPVLSFHKDLIPDSFRPLVVDIAERMQVPMDYPAVTLVNCLAGVVSRRAVIQPKANDTGWIVVPNLWGGIVAPPGFLKSPVIQAATRPLNQIQTEWWHEHEEAMEEYRWERKEHELLVASWQDQFKAATKKGNATPGRPQDGPEEPKLRRLIVNDATFEALHATMSENPAGILVIRDELTGWFAQLDRAGRENERAFCLEAWAGDSAFTVDRIGRGSIRVPHCCMSMLGGIQPGRLRSYLVDALRDGPSNDGLIQRFQLLVWPDTPPDWNYVDRAPNAAVEEQVIGVFHRLVQMDVEHRVRFRFDSVVQELFIDWLRELEAEVRGDELHPALISHLSKYRSLMPSLALLFHLAEGSGTDMVSFDSAWRAAGWCDYLKSHARRIYSCVVSPQLHAARELADKIKRRKVGADGFFSCRDVYLKGWAGLDSPEAAKQAADVLQDAGWIRDVSTESGRLGGRPSNRYQVNPEVWR